MTTSRPSDDMECPFCKSKKIFKFRLDNDWAYGAGDYYRVNREEHYSDEELGLDAFDRLCIEVYQCRGCHKNIGVEK